MSGAAAIHYPLMPTHLSLFTRFGIRQRSHAFVDIVSVNVAGLVVPPVDHVKPLGITLDTLASHLRHTCLPTDKRVNEVSRACFYHQLALRHI